MTTAVTETLFTAEEFARLPEPPNAGKMELVRGRVMVEMPVGGTHGERQVTVASALRTFAGRTRECRVTVETGYVLQENPDDVRAPDVSITPMALLPDGKLPDGFIRGAPSLAVEIVSPNDSERDVLEKVGDYLDAGVARVWVVRGKNQTVVVYRGDGAVRQLGLAESLSSDDAGFSTDGFSLPLSDIFS
jgi:Uma2 family endonuclease